MLVALRSSENVHVVRMSRCSVITCLVELFLHVNLFSIVPFLPFLVTYSAVLFGI